MSEKTLRELRFSFDNNKFEETPEGGLLVRDVRLLAPGYWTDSLSRQGTEYTLDAIKNAEWMDDALWARHGGGAPRSITDKVGKVVNRRSDKDGAIGDLLFHRKTQHSNEVADMAREGLFNYVSSEVQTVDSWNRENGRFQTDKIIFTGVACVNKGACSTCKITENSGENLMDTKELEESFGKIQKELEEKAKTLENRVKELEDSKRPKELEELKAKNDELEKKIAELESGKSVEELEKRVKELEDAPENPKTSENAEHELELPDDGIVVDRKTGEVYRR